MSERRPSIHVAGPGDLRALRELARTTFLDTYAAHNTAEDMDRYLAENFTEQRLAAIMAEAGALFLLMRCEGRLVGYAGLRQREPEIPLSLNPCWELERFYLVSACHGDGLAPILMEACAREARARGFAALWLGVWSENRRARRFYEKMGFQDKGQKIFVLGEDEQTDRLLVLPLV